MERAEAVKQFLVDSGVDPNQINTIALGKSKPRRPNTTEAGDDDPTGRRSGRGDTKQPGAAGEPD